ncbi:chitin-binding domain-containing protein [Streptomyces sp. NPDC048659]|uniref:chitin-binding domain-containing protein n=1 Tax=Streptomyces sp. NPDC048659 TaxID=3155489 RepID=UPI00341E52DA
MSFSSARPGITSGTPGRSTRRHAGVPGDRPLHLDLTALAAALDTADQTSSETARLAPQQPGDEPALSYNPETGQLHSTRDPGQVARLDPKFQDWIVRTVKESAAQPPVRSSGSDQAPQPYNYKYDVTESGTELHSGGEETGNESGRVEGSYYVLLPDNRLMTVTYYVDGESGFVPQISFQENANPF